MKTIMKSFRKVAALAVAMLAIAFSANAQTWYIMGEFVFSPPHPQGTFEVYQYAGEAVTISGLQYTTIYENDPYDTPAVELEGAYRVEGDYVYFREWDSDDNTWDQEELLYDYSLEVGDFWDDDDDHPMQVQEVTTITDNNGAQRKKITFSFVGLPTQSEFWIEGVGSSRGFLNVGEYEPTDDGAMYHLLCYHVNDNVIYINDEYNTCDKDEVAENELNNGISVYPNPVKGVAKINCDFSMNITKVEVIDMLGQTVMSVDNSSDINMSELPQGQYIMKIIGTVNGNQVQNYETVVKM